MYSKVNIKNRKASFEYQFSDIYISGIMLIGTEIKSIRNNKANISGAHCIFIERELFVKHLHISKYDKETNNNYNPKRTRKLLLNRKELHKMNRAVQEKGMTIIPIRLFINDKGKAKLEIAIAKGKKIHDKRQSIKEKDHKRDIKRTMK